MLRRQYAKYCDIADFSDPRLASMIPDVSPGHTAQAPHRKAWEFAMGTMFLEDLGLLDGTARLLDVGAGTAPILYWLAARAAEVVAVDIYGEGTFRDGEAAGAMLHTPSAFAPGSYPAERLQARFMDARVLEFEDASFDAVVSFSSIEHFGGRRGIRAAAGEIGRVLRPGGAAFIVTEGFLHMGLAARAPVQFACRVATGGRRCRLATPRSRSTEVLTRNEVMRDIVAASGLELAQPLDARVSPASYANPHIIRNGRWVPTTGEAFPHVMLGFGTSRFTSLAVPLLKPGR